MAIASGVKAREPRQKVLIAARMRVGTAWVDARIENISSRGLLVRSRSAPEPGTYLEIRRAVYVIVGRAVWRRGDQFGVRTQDRLDIDAIINLPPIPQGPRPATAAGAPTERRSDPERLAGRDIAQRLSRSRHLSSILQLSFLVFAGLIAAALVASAMHDILSRPLTAIERTLGGDKN